MRSSHTQYVAGAWWGHVVRLHGCAAPADGIRLVPFCAGYPGTWRGEVSCTAVVWRICVCAGGLGRRCGSTTQYKYAYLNGCHGPCWQMSLWRLQPTLLGVAQLHGEQSFGERQSCVGGQWQVLYEKCTCLVFPAHYVWWSKLPICCKGSNALFSGCVVVVDTLSPRVTSWKVPTMADFCVADKPLLCLAPPRGQYHQNSSFMLYRVAEFHTVFFLMASSSWLRGWLLARQHCCACDAHGGVRCCLACSQHGFCVIHFVLSFRVSSVT